MLAFAVAGYTNNLASYSKGNAQQAADSVGTLKRAHPYFSPALGTPVSQLTDRSVVLRMLCRISGPIVAKNCLGV